MTCRERAESYWKHEGWGDPRDETQARLWTLFFTDREPSAPYKAQIWVRPAWWIEDLVRS